MSLVLRNEKGSILTDVEMDNNIIYLNNKNTHSQLSYTVIAASPSYSSYFYKIKTNTDVWSNYNGLYQTKLQFYEGDVLSDITHDYTYSFNMNLQILYHSGTVLKDLLVEGGNIKQPYAPIFLGNKFSAAVRDIIVQEDGKFLVGGEFSVYNGQSRIIRLNSDGTEDISFRTSIDGLFSRFDSMAIQPDGKIVIKGQLDTTLGDTITSIVRLNSDGTRDMQFHDNVGIDYFSARVDRIVIQSDGKILVGGSFVYFNNTTRNNIFRLNSDGTEDISFYTNLGFVFNSYVSTIAIQTDGKILVGGNFTSYDAFSKNSLIRLNSDGTTDTAFFTNIGSGFNSTLSNIEVQPDGKILIGGVFTQFNGNTRNYLIRLNSDGTEDTSFYNNLGNGFNGNISTFSIQPDGKILIGGVFTQFNGNDRVRLVRLNSDGTEDSTFNNNLGAGFTVGYVNDPNIHNITIQPDGKILVGGNFRLFNGNKRDFLAVLNSDGTDYTNDDIFLSYNEDDILCLSSESAIDYAVYNLSMIVHK